MDPEPGHEEEDGPPPPPPAAFARSTSGWVPPSELPRADHAAADAGPEPDPAATWGAGGPSTAEVPVATRRRRRWPLVLAGLLLLGLAGTLVTLALTGSGDDADVIADPDSGTPGTAPEEERDGDGDARPPDRESDDLDLLDLDRLDGLDLVYGRLLTDIDASEREMIAFQTEVGEALAGATSGPEGLAEVAEVAAAREEGLLAVRDRLAEPLDDAGAEEVRRLYVEHLDSWADFIGAVAEDPVLIFEQSESGATVAINRTADRFARALEDELPEAADAEVARFADGILDRGFRGFGTADV